MKYYLIVGEASGDLHASNLMKALQKEDTKAIFRFWGGDLMASVGGELVKHYKELAIMGFGEVLKKLPTIAKNMRSCKADIAAFRPDVLILIDYSGFNLRIAKWAKAVGQRTFYYIAPQVWASRPKRAYAIQENIDQLFATLPFEAAFYKDYGMTINYVGHPLLDVVSQFAPRADFLQNHHIHKPLIALLPGSRKQEIERVLSILLPVVPLFKDYQFVIAAAPAIALSFYKKLMEESGILQEQVQLIADETYDILYHAEAALVTSGTATLEAALLGTPQVVCYKGSWLSYHIAKRVITVPYISLVNLIANKPLVEELIQTALTTTNVESALSEILRPEKSRKIKEGYEKIKEALGNEGASERTAKLMIKYLK